MKILTIIRVQLNLCATAFPVQVYTSSFPAGGHSDTYTVFFCLLSLVSSFCFFAGLLSSCFSSVGHFKEMGDHGMWSLNECLCVCMLHSVFGMFEFSNSKECLNWSPTTSVPSLSELFAKTWLVTDSFGGVGVTLGGIFGKLLVENHWRVPQWRREISTCQLTLGTKPAGLKIHDLSVI